MRSPKDARAVSPVVANVLMVVTTVILSAVLLVMVTPLITETGTGEDDDSGSVAEPLWSLESDIWSSSSDDPLIIDDGSDTNLSQGTITAWIKVTSARNWAGILLKGNVIGGSFEQSYGLQMASSGLLGYSRYCNNEEHNSLSGSTNLQPLFFICQNNSDDTAYYEYCVISPVSVTLEEWYFVVATWDSDNLTLDIYNSTQYLGGNWLTPSDVLATTGSGSAARQAITDAGGVFDARPSDHSLIIGAQGLDSRSTTYPFRGEIYEPRLFNTVLSDSEVRSLWIRTAPE